VRVAPRQLQILLPKTGPTIGPRSLLRTNRKSHTRFRLAPTIMTLDDLERLKRPSCKNEDNFEAHQKKIQQSRRILSAAKWSYLAPFRTFCSFICSWPHPYSTLILGVFPLHQIANVGIIVSRDLKLFGREIIFKQFQSMWSRYLIVTEGQTDGRTAGQTTHAIS